jgi:hypothetical protein
MGVSVKNIQQSRIEKEKYLVSLVSNRIQVFFYLISKYAENSMATNENKQNNMLDIETEFIMIICLKMIKNRMRK